MEKRRLAYSARLWKKHQGSESWVIVSIESETPEAWFGRRVRLDYGPPHPLEEFPKTIWTRQEQVDMRRTNDEYDYFNFPA